MIQINPIKIYEFLKRYTPHFIAIVVILFCLKQCNNTEVLTAEKDALEKQVKVSEQLIADKLSENELIQKNLIDKYKDTIAFLDSQAYKKQLIIEELNRERKNKAESVKNFNDDDMVRFYVDRYHNKNVFKTIIGVELQTEVSKKVVSDLVDRDVLDNLLIETTDLLAIEKDASFLKDSVINNLEYKEKNLNFVIKEKGNIIGNQNEMIKVQENIIKKQTRKNNLYKYAIPVAIVTGIVTGVLITK